jgi:hypothetical protein
VADDIITKLPPSWRNFATSLKHNRQEFSVPELIGTLDVEERARAKDKRGKAPETFANTMKKKNSFAFCDKKNKKNQQQNNQNKPRQTTK